MSSITVKTKNELKSAMDIGYSEIVVEGKLADDLKKGKKIAYCSAATLAVLGAAIVAIPATMPLTGGFSALAAAPVAALTGLEISAIIVAISIGVTLIVAVFKDYEEISYQDGQLVLKKTKS